MAVQPTIASAPVAAGQDFHQDTTVKMFLLGAVGYFVIVGIIALIIAAKFVWPEFLGTISYFTYGRMRPLHVNGMLFGWLLAADMGLAYYIVPRLCGVKLWSEKLGVATSILWNIIIISAIFSLLGGYQKVWSTRTCLLRLPCSWSSRGLCLAPTSSPLSPRANTSRCMFPPGI